jgi:type I restriction-modification system DNA methylase subunit
VGTEFYIEMKMSIEAYIEIVNNRFKSGISREHSYRGDLETLIRELVPGVEITNEPANVTDCGNPDYVITKGKIPVGYIEAKDIGKDLNSKNYKEQFDRYKKALDNLIITDYIWFQFFQNGELVHEIRIGEIDTGVIKPIADNFPEFENLIQNFCTHIGQTIKSSQKLAQMMASKARLLQNILERAITSDEETQENTSLKAQYETFKKILIHDLTPQAFADIYAQTLAYGMFAARLHDKTLDDFSRQEAAELIPKSNPFLRKLFGYVAGPDIDERIIRTVDNLADVFRATNVEQLLKNFGKNTQTQDPIIHFYETFLSEYDPKLRKARGVWYTPEPVVKFIVRAVDEILKTEFDLPQGLADTSKTKIKVPIQGVDKKGKQLYDEKEVHRVQILDPATGTGTFLAEVVKFIYEKRFKAMQGAWSSYVDEHLIPRLNGFELLMASYSMAHLKLDMLLRETGYKATKTQRFNVYLTNSLEEHHPDTGTLFSNWLSTEANEANHIKRDAPVMCVIGNPPYAVSSSNKGEWIGNLLKDYKKDLNEKKLNLDDDYIKFIRYGEYFINKTGEGVLAYISNNSFIDGVTHRQMRKHLLETFDKVYIMDLHGNAKKKETCPDGGKDENVFDIMQGVSINIFVKKKGE